MSKDESIKSNKYTYDDSVEADEVRMEAMKEGFVAANLNEEPLDLVAYRPNPYDLNRLVTKPINEEELRQKLTDAIGSTALSAKNLKATDFYGLVLYCRNVVIDETPRSIPTEKGNIEVRKTCWNVNSKAVSNTENEWFWVDTYTSACESYATSLLESMGDGPWSVYWPITFFGQVTKRHLEDGKETDCVRSV